MQATRPFQVTLNPDTGGLAPYAESVTCRLSDMTGDYADRLAVRTALAAGNDPVICAGFVAAVRPGQDTCRSAPPSSAPAR